MNNVTLKENAKLLQIKEQIIWRDSSGLTIEFCVDDHDKHHPFCIKIYGDCLKHGKRELTFSPEGVHNGGGTGLVPPECTIIPD